LAGDKTIFVQCGFSMLAIRAVNHPEGMKEGSRGLSDAQRAIPPVGAANNSRAPEGCLND
jgi:hypothetical protein